MSGYTVFKDSVSQSVQTPTQMEPMNPSSLKRLPPPPTPAITNAKMHVKQVALFMATISNQPHTKHTMDMLQTITRLGDKAKLIIDTPRPPVLENEPIESKNTNPCVSQNQTNIDNTNRIRIAEIAKGFGFKNNYNNFKSSNWNENGNGNNIKNDGRLLDTSNNNIDCNCNNNSGNIKNENIDKIENINNFTNNSPLETMMISVTRKRTRKRKKPGPRKAKKAREAKKSNKFNNPNDEKAPEQTENNLSEQKSQQLDEQQPTMNIQFEQTQTSATKFGIEANDTSMDGRYKLHREKQLNSSRNSIDNFGKQCAACTLSINFIIIDGKKQEMDNNYNDFNTNLIYQLPCCREAFCHSSCIYSIANLRDCKEHRRCPKCHKDLSEESQDRIRQLFGQKNKVKQYKQQCQNNSSLLIFNDDSQFEQKCNSKRIGLVLDYSIKKTKKSKSKMKNLKNSKSKSKSKMAPIMIHPKSREKILIVKKIKQSIYKKKQEQDLTVQCIQSIIESMIEHIPNFDKATNQVHVSHAINTAIATSDMVDKQDKECCRQEEQQEQEALFNIWHQQCTTAVNQIIQKYGDNVYNRAVSLLQNKR